MFKINQCIHLLGLDIRVHAISNPHSKNMCTSAKRNLAAVVCGAKDLRLQDLPLPKLKEDEVLARIEVCGISDSDIQAYNLGNASNIPNSIGHEASGTIVKIGNNVKNVERGDRVAIDSHCSCGKCEFCKAGKGNICLNQHNVGALCQFITCASDACAKLPKNMNFDDGALIGPLSVMAHAVRKVGVVGGDVVCIMGSGIMGLMAFLCARFSGASKIIVLDTDDSKLCKAKELGCGNILNVRDMCEEDLVKNIHAELGRPPNKTIDCIGTKESFAPCILATDRGGSVGIINMAEESIPLPLLNALVKELKIFGCFKMVNTYPLAIEMVSSGRVNLKPFISHKFKLQNTKKAFELLSNQQEPFLKVLIQVNSGCKS